VGSASPSTSSLSKQVSERPRAARGSPEATWRAAATADGHLLLIEVKDRISGTPGDALCEEGAR